MWQNGITSAAAMAQDGDVSGKRKKKKHREKQPRKTKGKQAKKKVPPRLAQQASPPTPNSVEEVVFDSGCDSVVVHEHEEGSLEPAAAPTPATFVRVGHAVQNVTVAIADALQLQCGVCFVALRPPIFQCEVGHVVCSACRDNLEDATTRDGKCHVCGVATRGYHRCHAMEQIVDCIRVPCPYSAHGCDATPPYHGKESHRQVCPHAPCHCPGESCGFIGSTAALFWTTSPAHTTGRCTTEVHAAEAFSIGLHFGFNFILLADQDRNDGEQVSATGGDRCRLFLLNVTQEQLGRAISVLCIHPHAANGVDQQLSTECELVVVLCYGDGSLCHSHYQSSVFKMVCTDLSDGLPKPEGCFHIIVPNAVLGVGDDKNSIQVKARIIN